MVSIFFFVGPYLEGVLCGGLIPQEYIDKGTTNFFFKKNELKNVSSD